MIYIIHNSLECIIYILLRKLTVISLFYCYFAVLTCYIIICFIILYYNTFIILYPNDNICVQSVFLTCQVLCSLVYYIVKIKSDQVINIDYFIFFFVPGRLKILVWDELLHNIFNRFILYEYISQ